MDESSDVVVEPAKTIPVHDRSVIYSIGGKKYGINLHPLKLCFGP